MTTHNTTDSNHDRDSYKAGWDAAVAAIKTFGIDEIDAIENATAPAEPEGEQENRL